MLVLGLVLLSVMDSSLLFLPSINNLDVTGQWQYFNLAVIKTVNAISSVELAGTYFIDQASRNITYTGQNVTQIRLTINDIFEKQYL